MRACYVDLDIDELAARDAAERARLRAKAIDDICRLIDQRRTHHAPTRALERHLARLRAKTA